MVPGDSWSTPKVRRVAKVTQEFLMVAFCGLAVATSFGGTTTQAILASTATSSQTMAPWAVWRCASESRRSCGQCAVSSGAVAECIGCSGRVGVCSRKGIGCGAAAGSACSSSEAVGSPVRRVRRDSSSVPRSGCPVWRMNPWPNKKTWTQVCHSSAWIRQDDDLGNRVSCSLW